MLRKKKNKEKKKGALYSAFKAMLQKEMYIQQHLMYVKNVILQERKCL